ncbi:nitroreductase [Candidatus Ruthia magnifica str. Cm (Calyptogena magnifica)]|uniref:Nitroreductase n=1 Tax=Ruthia magnifica subsp. Calyptogena magnifica TaxID=413404 RepID=A1AX87_RUTMC|nr:malonic semialdehyde reductase [Candidatus Ruthturnera calyptogenae]ABL02544.1 nitroreductase [Candidatus Ruthia magnifica str. Cm (Calyptogena magnifica)]
MLNKDALDTLFSHARSHNGWLKQDISEIQIHQIYELMKFAPTAANNCPARITFVKSNSAKQRLRSHLDESNIDKSMNAPAIAIISYDTEFYEKLPFLFPHTDAKSWYQDKPEKIKLAGEMNATLQGAYFIMASRAVGLDCGPMGGFNNETLDDEFSPNGKTKSIFLCGIGYGDHNKIFPRLPRLSFNTTCKII